MWSTDQDRAPRGFSLVELLISLAIFAIIGTITVAGYREAERSSTLRQESATLASNLRLLQTMASNGAFVRLCTNQINPRKVCGSTSDCTSPNTCTNQDYPCGGYGIHVGVYPSNVYLMIGDFETTTNDCSTDDGVYQANNDVVISNGNKLFPNNVRLLSGPTDYLFLPPGDANGRTRGNGTFNADATFLLDHLQVKSCRTVIIRGLTGQIQEATIAAGSGGCPNS